MENKLEAAVKNPLCSYMQAVADRQKSGQQSILALISRRSVGEKELESFPDHCYFVCLRWHEVYHWLVRRRSNVITNSLTEEFINYLKEMGMEMEMEGKFTFGEIGLAAYCPQLLSKLDGVLWHEELTEALKKLSC